MLRSLKQIFGYKIQATDDAMGEVDDFLFDDKSWTIRYLVVDTGKWLPGRQVLISPVALGEPSWETKVLPVSLTREQVENSPDISTDAPVSQRHEAELLKYYGWPAYWGVGVMEPPPPLTTGSEPRGGKQSDEIHADPHLRSCKDVLGYRIQATDGEIGHVEDFIADDKLWLIRYLEVDTRNWLPGKKVLVSPEWAKKVNWSEAKVHVEMARETVRNCPPFDPREPINREYEMRLYDYYGRPRYWP